MQVPSSGPNRWRIEDFASQGATPVRDCTYFDFAGMDPSINPGEDFYKYANGKWLANNPIPDAYRIWSSFEILRKEVNDRLVAIMKSLNGNESHEAGLCKAFYESAINMGQRREAGLQPLQHFLSKIDAIDSVDNLIEVIAKLKQIDVKPFGNWYISPHPYDILK